MISKLLRKLKFVDKYIIVMLKVNKRKLCSRRQAQAKGCCVVSLLGENGEQCLCDIADTKDTNHKIKSLHQTSSKLQTSVLQNIPQKMKLQTTYGSIWNRYRHGTYTVRGVGDHMQNSHNKLTISPNISNVRKLEQHSIKIMCKSSSTP